MDPNEQFLREYSKTVVNYFGYTDTEDKDQRLRQMKDIVRSVFGNEDFKISTAVISQQDLVELFISEMKQLM